MWRDRMARSDGPPSCAARDRFVPPRGTLGSRSQGGLDEIDLNGFGAPLGASPGLAGCLEASGRLGRGPLSLEASVSPYHMGRAYFLVFYLLVRVRVNTKRFCSVLLVREDQQNSVAHLVLVF